MLRVLQSKSSISRFRLVSWLPIVCMCFQLLRWEGGLRPSICYLMYSSSPGCCVARLGGWCRFRYRVGQLGPPRRI